MARPRAFDEEEVIDKAVHVFWRKGFADTSICDLEQALGMGRQSIYNSFGGKRELFLRAIKQHSQKGAEWATDLFKNKRGFDALEAYLKNFVLSLTASDERLGCFVTRCLVDHGTVDTDVANQCQSNETVLKTVFKNALQQAAEDGEFDADLVETTSTLISTHVYGLAVMARSGASPDAMRESASLFLEHLKR